MGKRQPRRTKPSCWSLVAVGILVVLAGLTVLASNLIITESADDHIVREPSAAPQAQCAIVLGARVYEDGTPAPMLTDRLETGVKLYRLGKVDKLLLSGDHGQTEYDKVNVMLDYVLERGVPTRDVFTDHAGFDTYDTMYRARDVFKVTGCLSSLRSSTCHEPCTPPATLRPRRDGSHRRHPVLRQRVQERMRDRLAARQGRSAAPYHASRATLPGPGHPHRRRRPGHQRVARPDGGPVTRRQASSAAYHQTRQPQRELWESHDDGQEHELTQQKGATPRMICPRYVEDGPHREEVGAHGGRDEADLGVDAEHDR